MFKKPKSPQQYLFVNVSWITHNNGGSNKYQWSFYLAPDSYESSFALELPRKMDNLQKQIPLFGRLKTLVVKFSSGISVFRSDQGTPPLTSRFYRGYGRIWHTKVGVCKSIFTLKSKIWEGRKLWRNIKIHGELVFVNFHFRKTEVFIFMILGRMGITGDP